MEPFYMFLFFEFNNKMPDFLFKNWNSTSAGELCGMCFAVLGMVLYLEISRTLNDYLTLYRLSDPVNLSTTVPVTETSPLLRALMIPPSNDHIKKHRLKIHILQTIVMMLQLAVGYVLMLAVMSYNAMVFLCVIFGSTLGYLVFTQIRMMIVNRWLISNQKRKQVQPNSNQETLFSSSSLLT